ncbi:restriction endonuclease subunit S [Enterococcus faecalis]|nr:restriction endonuclease subunit S [Enterococcus faecalis]EGO8706955.1 restriction endonuclease subunit S [Enterococcus faecalis]EGQ7401617.1 restriction endonuclease subunit S [Enterococcus faecalis]EHP0970685.1 restriction endonuclease subunit S [Enterococcus faecalis]EJR1648062.1 restriction endonuclease subunit S [Enterococcus faecalis]EOK19424.1 hypothetical protein WU5_02651 [Enterococcus faecalis EnGen0329]
MKKVPRLRFRGFQEDWELCKFERIFEKVKSYSLSREVETNEFTGMKYIHYGDIHTKKADKVSENSNIPNIIKKNFALLEIGDLILTDASEDYKGIATPAVIRENTSFDIVAGLHTIALRPKNIDPMFLYYLIKAPTFRKYGYKVGTGMKVFGISSSKVLDFTTYIPKNDETKLVSSFLEKIDYALDLHQRKLDQLKELKKAYLQLMFPKKDETVPQVRFADFEDDWQLCKLGDVVEIFDGTHQTPRYTDSGVKFVSVENIATLETKKYITHEAYEKEYSKKRAKKGDILMTRIGDIGTMKVIETDEPLAYYVTLALLKAKETNPYFLSFIISSPEIQRNIWKRTLHIAFPKKINLGEINQVEMKITIFEEQDKIGDLFTNLDDAIILNQNKLNQLKSLKKSYLQNMFI